MSGWLPFVHKKNDNAHTINLVNHPLVQEQGSNFALSSNCPKKCVIVFSGQLLALRNNDPFLGMKNYKTMCRLQEIYQNGIWKDFCKMPTSVSDLKLMRMELSNSQSLFDDLEDMIQNWNENARKKLSPEEKDHKEDIQKTFSVWDDLPRDMIFEIFSYLDHKDICRASQVCSSFRTIGDQDSLWIVLCNEFGWTFKSHEHKLWKSYFRSQYVAGTARQVQCIGIMGFNENPIWLTKSHSLYYPVLQRIDKSIHEENNNEYPLPMQNIKFDEARFKTGQLQNNNTFHMAQSELYGFNFLTRVWKCQSGYLDYNIFVQTTEEDTKNFYQKMENGNFPFSQPYNCAFDKIPTQKRSQGGFDEAVLIDNSKKFAATARVVRSHLEKNPSPMRYNYWIGEIWFKYETKPQSITVFEGHPIDDLFGHAQTIAEYFYSKNLQKAKWFKKIENDFKTETLDMEKFGDSIVLVPLGYPDENYNCHSLDGKVSLYKTLQRTKEEYFFLLHQIKKFQDYWTVHQEPVYRFL